VLLAAEREAAHQPRVADELAHRDVQPAQSADHHQAIAVLAGGIEAAASIHVAQAQRGGARHRRQQVLLPGEERGRRRQRVGEHAVADGVGAAEACRLRQFPVAAQSGLQLERELVALHMGAFAVVEIPAAAIGGLHRQVAGFRTGQRPVVAVEAGHRADVAVAVGVHRDAQVQGDAVIHALGVDAETPALKLPGQVQAELAAIVAVEAGIAHAVLDPVEATQQQLPAIGQRAAVGEVQAVQAAVADGVLEHAAGVLADLARDEVDRTGRGVGVHHRCRSAAYHLDAFDGFVQAECLVAVEVAQRRVMHHRDAVFQQGDRAEAVDRDAARADVAAGLAAGGFHPEPGHRFERLGHAGRRLHAQLLFLDVGDRVTGLGLGAHAGAAAAGDDDRIQVLGGGTGSAGGLLGKHGSRGKGGGQQQRTADGGSETVIEHDGPRGWTGEPGMLSARRDVAMTLLCQPVSPAAVERGASR